MSLMVQCGGCGKQFGAPDNLAGKTVRCPSCSAAITVASPGGNQARETTAVRLDPLDLEDLGNLEKWSPARQGGSIRGGSSGGGSRPRPMPRYSGGSRQSSAFPWVMVLGIFGGGFALLFVVAIMVVGFIVYSLSGDGDVEVASNSSGDYVTGDYGAGDYVTGDPGSGSPGSGGPVYSGPASGSPMSGGPMNGGPMNGGPMSGMGRGGGMTPPGPSGSGRGGTTRPGVDPFGSVSGGNGPQLPTTGTDSTGTDSTDEQGEQAQGTGPTSSKRESLIDAVAKWHEGVKVSGQREVEDHELVIYHYSWMTELLPELGHQKVYDTFNFEEVFITGRNQLASRTVIQEFLNPHDDREISTSHYFPSFGLTHFVGMAGVDLKRNSLAAELPRTDPLAGVFGYHEIAKPSDITDGTSNTIMLVGSGLLVGPWVSGGGHTIRASREPFFDPITGFGSKGLNPEGAMVMMADGSVRHLSSDVDIELINALCTIRGGETVDLSVLGDLEEDWALMPRVESSEKSNRR